MHIVLTILSIIGIILLVILGIIILLVLLLLFAPFRYSVRVIKDEDILAKGKVTWLLGLVRATVAFESKQLGWDLKLGPFSLKKIFIDKKEPKEISSEPEQPDVNKSSEPKKIDNNKPSDPEKIEKKKKLENQKTLADEASKQKTVKVIKTDTIEKNTVKQSQIPKERIPDKNGQMSKEKIPVKDSQRSKEKTDIPEESKIDRLIEKLKKIAAGIKEKLELAGDIKNAIDAVKGYVFKIIKHIAPRHLKGRLKFGMEDPSMTGKILAVISMFYTKLPKHVDLEPVFDHQVVECDLTLSGRIHIIVLVVYALKIYFNKEVKVVLKRIKGGK